MDLYRLLVLAARNYGDFGGRYRSYLERGILESFEWMWACGWVGEEGDLVDIEQSISGVSATRGIKPFVYAHRGLVEDGGM